MFIAYESEVERRVPRIRGKGRDGEAPWGMRAIPKAIKDRESTGGREPCFSSAACEDERRLPGERAFSPARPPGVIAIPR
jgi:hypothetical protein